MGLLAGKKTLVTGASKGIGRSIALKFAQEGADVAFTYLSSVEQAQALEEELAAFGGQVLAVRSDASQFEAAQELIAESLKAFGTLDVLVNNAGITKDNLLMRMSEEDFDRVLKVNLNSIFNTTKAVIRPMMKQKAGSIINISSVVGREMQARRITRPPRQASLVLPNPQRLNWVREIFAAMHWRLGSLKQK